jgi:formylglycine-generating enzyme required for sulfatase activity
MIVFSCAHCGKPLRISTDKNGEQVTCPHCAQIVSAPVDAVAAATPGLERATRVLPPLPAALSESATGSVPGMEADLAGGVADVNPESAETLTLAELRALLAPPQQPDELGRLGSYRILQLLGHGGMGAVFRAEDPRLGRQVALKIMLPSQNLSPTARQRFLREARLAATLEHVHIITVFQVDEDRGILYMVMPFLKGEPLDARLRREKTLPVAEILRIGREIAEGLAAAHARGLIHRDIKPGNIWLEGPRQRVIILDFGLACAREDRGQLTRTGVALGTPAYMAPEQANGLEVDERSDLFSLGCVLYRLSTGRVPFQGSDTLSILLAVVNAEPQAPQVLNPVLPSALCDLTLQLLAKTPADRPASAQVVAETLAELERTLATPPANDPLPMKTTHTLAAHHASSPAHVPAGACRTADRSVAKWFTRKGGLLGTAALILVLSGLYLWWFPPWSPTPTAPVASIPTSPPTVPPPPQPGQPHERPKELENSIGMKLVLIPAGEFDMGSPDSDPDAREAEKPQHRVRISRPFFLGKYEVTQGQYQQIMGGNPSLFSASGPNQDWRNKVIGLDTKNFPVENVSWEEAQEFCRKLSALEAEKAAGRVYRLPTEAEWELACRAGSTTIYSFGDDATKLDDYAWHHENSDPPTQAVRGPRPHPVGEKLPNAYGLYDLHGNVWEWCRDSFDAGYYPRKVKEDPPGPDHDGLRILRGGSWADPIQKCRAANRRYDIKDLHNFNVGFRIALSVPKAP